LSSACRRYRSLRSGWHLSKSWLVLRKGLFQAGEELLARAEVKLVSRRDMFEAAHEQALPGGGVPVQLEHVGLVVRIAGLGFEDHVSALDVASERGRSVGSRAVGVVPERSGFGLDGGLGGRWSPFRGEYTRYAAMYSPLRCPTLRAYPLTRSGTDGAGMSLGLRDKIAKLSPVMRAE